MSSTVAKQVQKDYLLYVMVFSQFSSPLRRLLPPILQTGLLRLEKAQ